MAEAIVSLLLEQLVSIPLEEAKQMVRLVMGVEEEVENLTSNFQAIQAVLEGAERRQVKEPSVRLWLDKLKDASYDMDDVLDEWYTTILERQIKRQEDALQIEAEESALETKRKVRPGPSIFSSCFCFKQAAQRHEIAVKIIELNAKLERIANEKLKFHFSERVVEFPEPSERRITASFIDNLESLHGRDQDMKKLRSKLLAESSQEPTLRIISIVGMGGIGKTTLAQLVYNDETVEAHFQTRIWVGVSKPFDEIRIAKAILESLTGNASNLNELDPLLQLIRHSIRGKLFLLVLDDVWTEDENRVEQLKRSLKSGLPGSRILVTTRKETVANILETNDVFPLGQLSDDECWSIFSQVAFREGDVEGENLKVIGRGISDKCKGLPLAAKVLGNFLCAQMNREKWQSVLDSELWELEVVEVGIFPPLLLSYYDLPTRERQCFSYCAIFPRDYKIEKNRLIKLWMAQGYFIEKNSVDMEMAGEECFNRLAMHSFFQDLKKEDDGTTTCKMHDVVHDFAQFLSKKECQFMEVNVPRESRFDVSNVKTRHSMLMLAERGSIPASISKVKSLRSLIVEYKGFPV